MYKVGWETNTGLINQTDRTVAKIHENTQLLMKDVKQNVLSIEAVRVILETGLRWTADDVLKQCMADGYDPKEMGQW